MSYHITLDCPRTITDPEEGLMQCGGGVEVEVEVDWGYPAKLDGLPENCYPGEGISYSIIDGGTCEACEGRMTVDEADTIEMAFTPQQRDAAIEELDRQHDGFDRWDIDADWKHDYDR